MVPLSVHRAWRWPGLIALVLLTLLPAAAARATEVLAGPMVGHVTDTNARIWMQLSSSDVVRIRCLEVGSLREVSSISLDVEGPWPFICDAAINGLHADRNYRIEVTLDTQPVRFRGPELVIHTAPPPGDAAAFALAFGGGFHLPAKADATPATRPALPIFQTLTDLQPRCFLFLGNIGTLPAAEADFPRTRREAYRLMCNADRQLRNRPELQGLFRTAPIYATWDARDFGPERGDRTFVYAAESLAAFQHYWPNPGYGTVEAPGTFSTFSMGDVDVFLLDSRMYRDPPGGASMLGPVQLAWLQQQLKASRASVKVLAGGCPLLTDTPGSDGWGGYPKERDAFIRWLAENKIGGVVSISGSRQAGELSCRKPDTDAATPYPLYELTAGPLVPGPRIELPDLTNPLRDGKPLTEANFGTLEFAGPRSRRHVILRLRDAGGQVQAEKTVFVSDLRGP